MDGNDLGMIARVFMFLLKGLKYVLKLVWFTGLWWFCVPLVVGIGYEEITGTFIQNNQIMDGIFTILWYACYVLCPLNFSSKYHSYGKKRPQIQLFRASFA